MKENIKSLIFNKTFAFLLFIWMSYDINNVRGVISLDKQHGYITLRSNRLLLEPSLDLGSIEYLNYDDSNSTLQDEDIYKNDHGYKSEIGESRKSFLSIGELYKLDRKKKSSLLSRMDKFCEKYIFNQLDSIYKVKDNKFINKMTANKKIFKKVVLAVIPPCLAMGAGLIIVTVLSYLFCSTLLTSLSSSSLLIVLPALIACMPILSIMCIAYIFRKFMKYEKIYENKPKLTQKLLNLLFGKNFNMASENM
ncbi:PIR Superfamily Protein [Plasmodium malariae]|uniref:PIR Superfamily Protein n=1 Tax=Plasmodium malariae TaxID=5858 RepID=A0A1A8XA23_PLAMA|nr:PIR Superfamily Protein [Plasmodium malariae]